MPLATVVVSASNNPQQLSSGDPQGTIVGVSGGAVAFFGGTPLAQLSGNAQSALTRGNAGGSIISFTSRQSPGSVQAGTSAETTHNLLGNTQTTPINAGDLVYVNKPTSQAGLGIGNVRAVGVNQVAITATNYTGTTIAPTVSEAYTFTALRNVGQLSAILSPSSVPGNRTQEQTFAVTGLQPGELVQVNKPTAQAGLDIVGCRVVSNNTLGITFANVTAASITPTAAETYTVMSLAGLDAVNNEVLLAMTGSPTSIAAAITTTEYLFPVTGLVLGDTVKGISKPTMQNGLSIGGFRVSVPGVVGVQFVNSLGTTTTPTAGEVYEFALNRAAPAAPMVIYNQALTPTAVPGNSTEEQTFTVTGLVAGSMVWVNKPSPQAGLGIAGVRVSAANTLAINFCNTTASSIVPTAGEVYKIGNFQDPAQTGGVHGVGTGNAVIRGAMPVFIRGTDLLAALRTALVSTNFIAGA